MQAAQIAHAQDVPVAGPSRKSVLYTQGHAGPSSASSGPKRPDKPVDKFANYSTAAQLGLAEEATAPSTYEVEQMIGGKDTKIGQWEEIVNEPTGLHSTADGDGTGHGSHRAADDEEAEGEGWKFQHKGKRPVRDPYDDDDFDPSAILKMRKRVKAEGPAEPEATATSGGLAAKEEEKARRALDREAWSGRIELNGKISPTKTKKDGLVYVAGGGWVKEEATEEDVDSKPDAGGDQGIGSASQGQAVTDRKPGVESDGADVKPDLEAVATTPVQTEDAPVDSTAPASGGLFKKRRPPPSSRKK